MLTDFLLGLRASWVTEVTLADRVVPCFTGSFWSQTQRDGHSLHETPYRACFKPSLPRFFINGLTKPGQRVLDPFMGRGTTVLEAALCERKVYGADISPVSIALAMPRLDVPDRQAIDRWCAEFSVRAVKLRDRKPPPEHAPFFHPHTYAQLLKLREEMHVTNSFPKRWRSDCPLRFARMALLTRLHGHSVGFCSVRSMPPNIGIAADRQRVLNKRAKVNPLHARNSRDVGAIIRSKVKSLLRDFTHDDARRIEKADASIHQAPASGVADRVKHDVSLVVTSPPFLDTTNYEHDHELRRWFLRCGGSSVPSFSSIPEWRDAMTQALRSIAQCLKRNGVIAWEVGEVRKGSIDLEHASAEAAKAAGLVPRALLLHEARFTKTAHAALGVENNTAGTNTQRVLLLTKEKP